MPLFSYYSHWSILPLLLLARLQCALRRGFAGGVALAVLLVLPAAAQQTDTIRVADRRLLTKRLQPGTRQYLVYYLQPARPKALVFSLWRRSVQRTQYQGAPAFRIDQRWYGTDTSSYRTVSSLVRAADFAPLYHTETVSGQRNAYNWYATEVVGADSVAGNQALAFTQPFHQLPFNWNLDIETFELLPLAAGKRFVLPFYDAGRAAPTYVLYTVSGREVLAIPGSRPVACWKLVTEGRTPANVPYTQTFWISQRGHEFLQEEDRLPGFYRYKVKLSTVPSEWPQPTRTQR